MMSIVSSALDKSLWRTVALCAGAGLLIGTTRNATRNLGLTGKLDPEPEAFAIAPQVRKCFLELQRYKNASNGAEARARANMHFTLMIRESDKILYLESQLALGVPPDAADLPAACGYMAQIEVSSAEFLGELPLQVQVRVEEIFKDLFHALRVHMSNVTQLCEGKSILPQESKLDRELEALIGKYK